MMLANLLKFGELRVSDVMMPRADIVAVDEETSLADFIALFREVQHSRLPVYRETLDDPTGLVHIKDVLAYMQIQPDGSFRWKDGPISQFKRELLFVPPSMPLVDLLLKMQTTHTHLALVIDEYGGTDGLVSIEDIIEEIVGDIADEHDEDAAHDPQIGRRHLSSPMRASIWRISSNQTGIALAPEDADQEIDTLGGLVVSLLGRVPQRGEIVTHPSGYEFEVLEADPAPRQAPARARSGARAEQPSRREVGVTSALLRDRRLSERPVGLAAIAARAFAAGAVSALGFRAVRCVSAFSAWHSRRWSSLLDGASADRNRIRGAACHRLGLRLRPVRRRHALDLLSLSRRSGRACLADSVCRAPLSRRSCALFGAGGVRRRAAFWNDRSGAHRCLSRSATPRPNGCAVMS